MPRPGVMGTAIVRQNPINYNFLATEFPLGYNVGESADAEIFAITAALGMALDLVQQGLRAPVVITSLATGRETPRAEKYKGYFNFKQLKTAYMFRFAPSLYKLYAIASP
ncbi:uncharacterized protein BDZ99DRAFT_519268 [Mytilinidion resinicola]|uniref:Uncharacterized protein n=1 Tax=Mytilinidion resinicola TaxID=574789 RepID=A0A6A6YPT9_9PEZI|nr:uncharacterized protein BDZ99DRAFT_519268 [Mytilinidion resinicola]KAF2810573.1 hypothetical protein BDZ99DRAFT_519268 [Mytilinidion resinicola]